MPLLRGLVAPACLTAVGLVVLAGPTSGGSAAIEPRALAAPMDVLYAAPGNANYSYGPTRQQRSALAANVAATSTFQVTYTGFGAFPAAQTAFQAAVDIWAHTIVSPVPIRVSATFAALAPTILGQAGPSVACTSNVGIANTAYAAALADALKGSAYCAALGGSSTEISATFNSSFSSWDFGTSGTGVSNQYNFMTVVLHELGHGLGLLGGTRASGGVGTLSSMPWIYDRFATTGAGLSLLSFANPSVALGSQLVSNDTFFSGSHATAVNGTAPKLETHNFTTAFNLPSDAGFVQGSSYSHIDEVLYSQTPNGLMTYALAGAEVYTDPGPVVRSIFQDEGWTLAGAGCSYAVTPLAPTATAAGGIATMSLTATAGCSWTAASNSPFITITSALSGVGPATISYSVAANTGASFRKGTLTIGGQLVTLGQNGLGPTMALDRTSLVFSAINSGAAFVSKTDTQQVRLTKNGSGTVTWTASSNQPWLTVTPTSGSGSATLTVATQFAPGLTTAQSGAVTLTFGGAGNSTGPIATTLRFVTNNQSAAPFGSFDTPVNNTTGVTGSLAITGWAMDDIDVTQVRVLRDPVPGEPAGVLVPVGTAVLVDGARPDISALYPTYPRNTRAGWGYLMLTNMLPAQGNGTFRLYAYADDVDGHSTLLGTRTITCANAAATAPFGAIDTPRQGEVVSGTLLNFGWTLVNGTARADVPGGGTVSVVVDGVPVGVPIGWTDRTDISALFPNGVSDITSTLAVLPIDTTALANGVHTIAWGVTATNGQTAGIGSRYFTVSNGSVLSDQSDAGIAAAGLQQRSAVIAAPAGMSMPRTAAHGFATERALRTSIDAAPLDGVTIRARRGFDLGAPRHALRVSKGVATIQAEELDRVELQLSDTAGYRFSGYLRTESGLAPLPVGSHLDEGTGQFTWQPGVGFVGAYNFAFLRWAGGIPVARQEVQIVLAPQGSGRVGPQVVIDTPTRQQDVGQPFVVAGWAADLDSGIDTGVDAVHVWAYPLTGGDPVFVGAATIGGTRPDVAEVYGDRFTKSGYGLVVRGLVPGNYDLAVFGYSTVTGGFVPAKVVRITVR
jgi:hypothetical protein